MITLNYGTLPPKEKYNEAFDTYCKDGLFRVKAGPLTDVFDSVAGSGLECPAGFSMEYDKEKLWRLLNELTAIWEDEVDDLAGQDASNVLQLLGFEWV